MSLGMTTTIGSLFSGIGGLELGLERAGLGPVVWQVEVDAFCREVLSRHWPHVERFDDVRTVGSAVLRPVDLICGGFPCQDVSSAGKRAGLAGPRSGLWFEYLRIIGELRPRWVVVENVASGASAWVDTVRGGLGQLGYASIPIPIAAADVGAPHERARVFLVAHADVQSESAVAEHAQMAGASAIAAHAHGTVVRDEPRWRSGTHGQSAREPPNDCEAAPADADGARREGSGTEAHQGRERFAAGGWRSPQPSMVRVVHGISRGLDSPRRRIKALGNAVVPQCAEVIGHVIRELGA